MQSFAIDSLIGDKLSVPTTQAPPHVTVASASDDDYSQNELRVPPTNPRHHPYLSTAYPILLLVFMQMHIIGVTTIPNQLP
uniref:Uncharacterized protein n=1 Tax=Heterorhabditis bacteriophora TaxID=37862 RepID=A0A1I7WQZ4_HETBA